MGQSKLNQPMKYRTTNERTEEKVPKSTVCVLTKSDETLPNMFSSKMETVMKQTQNTQNVKNLNYPKL